MANLDTLSSRAGSIALVISNHPGLTGGYFLLGGLANKQTARKFQRSTSVPCTFGSDKPAWILIPLSSFIVGGYKIGYTPETPRIRIIKIAVNSAKNQDLVPLKLNLQMSLSAQYVSFSVSIRYSVWPSCFSPRRSSTVSLNNARLHRSVRDRQGASRSARNSRLQPPRLITIKY